MKLVRWGSLVAGVALSLTVAGGLIRTAKRARAAGPDRVEALENRLKVLEARVAELEKPRLLIHNGNSSSTAPRGDWLPQGVALR